MKTTDKIFSIRYQLKYLIEGCNFPSYVHFNCISSCFEFLKRSFISDKSVIYYITDLDLNKLVIQSRF